MTPSKIPDPTELSGTVKRIIRRDDSDGWTVLVLTLKHGEEVTVSAKLPSVHAGLRLEAKGAWREHKLHGREFKSTSARAFMASSLVGVERFLASGAIKLIGPKFAKRLVKNFGDKTLDICLNRPHVLRSIRGVGAKRALSIQTAVREYQEQLAAMTFLHERFGPALAERILAHYGAEAVNAVAKNPYKLIDEIDGVGFDTADKVALKTGVSLDSVDRIAAALRYTILESGQDGHTCMPQDELLEEAGRKVALTLSSIRPVLDAQVAEGALVVEDFDDRRYVYTKRTHFLEKNVAKRLTAIREAGSCLPVMNAEAALNWAQGKLKIHLEERQREAIANALRSAVCVIRGGPGRGKTSIIKALVLILKAKNVKFALAAPTGRAAKRLAEATGEEATTLHRLLRVDGRSGRFIHDAKNPLDVELLIIDEYSMVDLWLKNAVLEALPTKANLVCVGDEDQLPSVGIGRVFRDIVESRAFSEVKLLHPFRQGRGSAIIDAADRVNKGLMPDLDPGGKEFRFIETRDAEETARVILRLASKTLPAAGVDPMTELMVLVPMHKGACGVDALNTALQKILLPATPQSVMRGSGPTADRFGVGDKVMQVRNDRQLDIYNGDLGIIREIVREKDGYMMIEFDSGLVRYPLGTLRDLKLAYVSTVHKAQGGEAPNVIMAVDSSATVLLDRQLLYTGITRAKQRAILVGQPRAIAHAVRTAGSSGRMTHLMHRLRAAA